MRWLLLIALGCQPKADAAPAKTPMTPEEIERYNKAIPYRNEAIHAQNAGDWAAARQALQRCVEELGDPDCASELRDLESKHRF